MVSAVEAMNAGRFDEADRFLKIAERSATRDELWRVSVPLTRIELEGLRGHTERAGVLLDEAFRRGLLDATQAKALRRRFQPRPERGPDRVRHAVFGLGVVIRRVPGTKEKAVVDFEVAGTKTVLASTLASVS